MKYKMICLDIDGTLLDDNKHIQLQVKESLHRASEQGIQIALSTGRMPAGAELIEQELGIDLSETIAFGDQELDIPMVEIDGLGIAYALEQYLRP